jgi:hypothetical protein
MVTHNANLFVNTDADPMNAAEAADLSVRPCHIFLRARLHAFSTPAQKIKANQISALKTH